MTDEITWDELLAQTKSRPRKTVEESNDQLIALRAFNQAQMNVKPTKKRGNPEMQIVNEILDYLKKRGDIYCFRANAGKVLTNKNQWFQGVPAGVSDCIGLITHGPRSGSFLAIEVKTKSNPKPTDLQQQFIDAVVSAGGVAFVALSVEDVATRLDRELGDLGIE